jgi:hypothetical protein
MQISRKIFIGSTCCLALVFFCLNPVFAQDDAAMSEKGAEKTVEQAKEKVLTGEAEKHGSEGAGKSGSKGEGKAEKTIPTPEAKPDTSGVAAEAREGKRIEKPLPAQIESQKPIEKPAIVEEKIAETDGEEKIVQVSGKISRLTVPSFYPLPMEVTFSIRENRRKGVRNPCESYTFFSPSSVEINAAYEMLLATLNNNMLIVDLNVIVPERKSHAVASCRSPNRRAIAASRS